MTERYFVFLHKTLDDYVVWDRSARTNDKALIERFSSKQEADEKCASLNRQQRLRDQGLDR